MARTFYTNGILQQQQTRSANTSKIPIYDNETALDADLANIPDNTLVATKGGHDDVINQMKAYIRNQNVLSAYETATANFTADYDGFVTIYGAAMSSNSAGVINVNNVLNRVVTNWGGGSVSVAISKGDTISCYSEGGYRLDNIYVRYYKLRDYKGR